MKSMPALQQIHSSPAFTLDISFNADSALIGMQVHSSHVTTDTIPNTKSLLKQFCPSVLKTRCFNDLDLPFDKEVMNTELGHLFEHILIDYLCEEAISDGAKSAKFNGTTKWNWNKQPRGFFEINISLEKAQAKLLTQAMARTIEVMESLFSFDYEAVPVERAVLAARSNQIKQAI